LQFSLQAASLETFGHTLVTQDTDGILTTSELPFNNEILKDIVTETKLSQTKLLNQGMKCMLCSGCPCANGGVAPLSEQDKLLR
jgi:hypothetical protein